MYCYSLLYLWKYRFKKKNNKFFFKGTVKQNKIVYWVDSLKQELNTNILPYQQSCRHSQHVSLQGLSRKHCRRLQSTIILSYQSDTNALLIKKSQQECNQPKVLKNDYLESYLVKIKKVFKFDCVESFSLSINFIFLYSFSKNICGKHIRMQHIKKLYW